MKSIFQREEQKPVVESQLPIKKRKRHGIPQLNSVSDKFVVDLPEDIITEILTRLSVKTLIKLRCVCKSWLCLISHPRFIKTHLMKSSNPTQQKLIINDISKTLDSLYSCVIGDGNIHSYVPLEHPLKAPRYEVSILGSCNGLVCVHVRQVGTFLWNPCTRKYKNLYWDIESRDYSTINFGFGYDQLNDDYKVVTTDYHNLRENRVMVYSARSDSWEQIQSFPRRIFRIGYGKYVNGVLYWVKTNLNIVSFNLGNELVGKLSKPCYDRGILYDMVLGVLDGCLSASCNINKTCIDLWVMISDSWVKLFTIPHSTNMDTRDVYAPFHNFKACEIWLKSEISLFLYNPKNCSFGSADNLLNLGRGFEVTTYIESLISPYLDDVRS